MSPEITVLLTSLQARPYRRVPFKTHAARVDYDTIVQRPREPLRRPQMFRLKVVEAVGDFGFDMVRYKGLTKNHHRLCANFDLVNLYLHRRRLAVLG